MAGLAGIRVAVIATDGVEERELTEPMRALRDAGAQVELLSGKAESIQGFRHHEKGLRHRVDTVLEKADPAAYDALVLPGGALNADALRIDPRAQAFVRAFDRAGKPIAFICHAPWLLVSAGLVRGRRLTSYVTIADDIRNAGGEWSDAEVVEDGNWISSRKPDDLPAFDKALLKRLVGLAGRHAA